MTQLALFEETTDGFPPMAKVSPLLKYAGGKRWLIPYIAPAIWGRLLTTRGYYIEPFIGGGAIAFHLGVPQMVLTDLSRPVIDLYQAVKEDPSAVVWALSALAMTGVDEESYYRVRDSRPEKLVDRAARMIYMNKLGFNGLQRENKSGNFNVPYDKSSYRQSIIKRKSRDAVESLFPHKGKFEAVSQILQDAEIAHIDFEQVIDCAGENDIIYADPPYDNGFAAYTGAGFTADDQKRLSFALERASSRGVAIVASNADTELIRELYAWAPFRFVVAESRQINSDASKRKTRAGCLLISNDESMVRGAR